MKSFFCFLSLSLVFFSSTACAASAENWLSADDIKQLEPAWYTRKRAAIGGVAFFLGLGGAIGFPFLRRFLKKKGFSAKILNALTAAAIVSGVVGVAGLVPVLLRKRLEQEMECAIPGEKSETVEQLEKKGDSWIRLFKNYCLWGRENPKSGALRLRNAAFYYHRVQRDQRSDPARHERAKQKKIKASGLAKELYPTSDASPTSYM